MINVKFAKLLEAYALLPESRRVPLVIGGGKGWQYGPVFEAIERLKLGDSVRFAGFIPSEDLPLWYNSARAFMYPSVFEGFGLPVLEAMACGTPVVVSDASSLPEVAGDAGLLVPPHDVNAWREALEHAFDDDRWRAEARTRGLERAGHFTWVNTALQTLAGYVD
jgi:glycosyltransferase involved in cell wall biosynthesis